MPPLLNLQYRPVRREERGMFILHHFLIDVYALFSDVSLRRQALCRPRLRNSRTLFAQDDVNLFNHLVRKADVAGCCSWVLFFVDMRLPRIQCR